MVEQLYSNRVREQYTSINEAPGPYQLLSLLGEKELSQLFGFADDELSYHMRRYTPRVRKLENKDIEAKYTGFLKIHNVERDIERFRDAGGDATRMREEIAGIGVPGFESLLKEYLFGKNTFFYNKVVRNPVTGKSKIVSYDPITNSGEGWEAAWAREDLRVSYKRFIDRKAEEDPLYAARLQYRDKYELDLMDVLVAESNKFSESVSEKSPILMSLSPAPRPSAYARDMGYASWWHKRLSHWRSYGFEKVDDSVLVHASTVFTYRNIHRMRHLMKEVVRRDGQDAQKVRRLSTFSSDGDLLATPFVSYFETEQRNDFILMTENIDTKLNVTERWYDPLFAFSDFATRWHNSKRLTDTEGEKMIISELARRYFWEYYVVLLESNGRPDPNLLKEILIEMREKALDLYGEVMAEEMVSKDGRLDKEKLKLYFIASAMVRERGGNCPTVNNRRRRTQNGEEDDDDEQECLLVCGGKKFDALHNCIVKCSWSAKAEKGVIYKECPECGWSPGKVQSFDIVQNEKSKIILEIKSEKKSEHRLRELHQYVKASGNTDPLLAPVERSTAIPLYDEEMGSSYILTPFGRSYFDRVYVR